MLVVVPTLLDFIITISSRHLPLLSPRSSSLLRPACFFFFFCTSGKGWRAQGHSLAHFRRFFEFISRKRGAAEYPVFQIVLMGDALYVRRLTIAPLANLSSLSRKTSSTDGKIDVWHLNAKASVNLKFIPLIVGSSPVWFAREFYSAPARSLSSSSQAFRIIYPSWVSNGPAIEKLGDVWNV